MKNQEKQTKEEPKNPKKQVQIKSVAENLSEAELEKVAGGGSTPGFIKATSRMY
jgi:hypothetical protein